MTKPVLIFDFDGTIADTFECSVKAINDLADEYGYRRVEGREIDYYRGKGAREIFKEFKIPLIKVPAIARRLRQVLSAEIKVCSPIKGVKRAIKELKKEGYHLGIITSNSEENVKTFLAENKMEYFDFIHSEGGLFGKDRVIKKVLKQIKINKSDALYIGDEVRDIDAARKAGIKVIAVSWGFNSKSALARQNPDLIVDEPRELVLLIERLANAV